MSDSLSLTQLRETVDRTVAAGTARITLHIDFSRTREAVDPAPRRRGILPTLARAIARRLPRNLDAEGFLDLAGRRAMFDQGQIALLQLDDRVWSGRPGRTLDSLEAGASPQWFASPLWLFDTLSDVTTLEDHGLDGDPTRPWRHVTTLTTVQGSDETVEVWLDGTHIRQLRLGRDTTSMTLNEFGIDVDSLDWTRLPSFRARTGTS